MDKIRVTETNNSFEFIFYFILYQYCYIDDVDITISRKGLLSDKFLIYFLMEFSGNLVNWISPLKHQGRKALWAYGCFLKKLQWTSRASVDSINAGILKRDKTFDISFYLSSILAPGAWSMVQFFKNKPLSESLNYVTMRSALYGQTMW